MKQPKLEDLNLTAIVEAELEKRNCDGLYSPCNLCECGCSRTKLFSCGKACADCRPGMQHPGTSDLKIVPVDEYCEIIDRIEAERKRLNEKRRAEAAANKKTINIGILYIPKELNNFFNVPLKSFAFSPAFILAPGPLFGLLGVLFSSFSIPHFYFSFLFFINVFLISNGLTHIKVYTFYCNSSSDRKADKVTGRGRNPPCLDKYNTKNA